MVIAAVGPVTIQMSVTGGSAAERSMATSAVRQVSETLAELLGDAMEAALRGPPVELPKRAQPLPWPAAVPEVAGVDPAAVGDAEAEPGVPAQSLA